MFGRLRWLAIVLPGLTVAVIELLSDNTLDQALPFPWDTVFVVAIVVALAFVLSFFGFRRIDGLTRELAAQNAELERRNATVRALHRVSLAITGIAELDHVLAAVVDQARELLEADGAALLLDTGTGDLVARATSGADLASLQADESAARLEAPLQRGGSTLGRLVVASRGSRSYGAGELETLSSLASQAAIAVENARLQERLRELAVAEERERIAREMHDGLAQVLGYVNTKSQAVEHLLDEGRVTDARTQLNQLASAARSIYVDVREAILGLRSAIDPGAGLVRAIESYADRFAEASKLVVQVRASAEARAVSLPEPSQSHVFRVVQESLTNVRKHAAAHRALVALESEAGTLVLQISDDGVGLQPSGDKPTDWPHYGMAAMRERAMAIGGSIDWESIDGESGAAHGTIVRLTVPLATGLGAPR